MTWDDVELLVKHWRQTPDPLPRIDAMLSGYLGITWSEPGTATAGAWTDDDLKRFASELGVKA